MVFAPRLIIVPCSVSEGAENAFKIMFVLQSNVLLNNRDTSRPFYPLEGMRLPHFTSGLAYNVRAGPQRKILPSAAIVLGFAWHALGRSSITEVFALPHPNR